MLVETIQKKLPKTERRSASDAAVLAARRGVPEGTYHVDADALRKARRGVPRGEYHVDADALRKARRGVPRGEYHVDADALRIPRAETMMCMNGLEPSHALGSQMHRQLVRFLAPRPNGVDSLAAP